MTFFDVIHIIVVQGFFFWLTYELAKPKYCEMFWGFILLKMEEHDNK